MHKIYIGVVLVISTIASAADLSRCGKDQFGNSVCLDKDGVLTTPSRSPEESGKEVAVSGASAVEAKETQRESKEKLRCGIDPFGNKVCR